MSNLNWLIAKFFLISFSSFTCSDWSFFKLKICYYSYFYLTNDYSIFLAKLSILYWAYFIYAFFMLAPLKFFASAIDFCYNSSFGILDFIWFLFYYKLFASDAAFAFLNYNSLILSFFSLCLSSNCLSCFVLWIKLSTLTLRS